MQRPAQLFICIHVDNNPLKYTDSTGHCKENGDEACWSQYEALKRQAPDIDPTVEKFNYSELRALTNEYAHFNSTVRTAAEAVGLPPAIVGATVDYERTAYGPDDLLQDFGLSFGDPTIGPAQMDTDAARVAANYIKSNVASADLQELIEAGYIPNPTDEQLRDLRLNLDTATILAAGYLGHWRDYRVDNPGAYPDSFAGDLTTDQQLILYNHYTAGGEFQGWNTATQAGSITTGRLLDSGILPRYQQIFGQ